MIFVPDLTVGNYVVYKYPGMVYITHSKRSRKIKDITGLENLIINSMITQKVPHKGYFIRIENDDRTKYYDVGSPKKWREIND